MKKLSLQWRITMMTVALIGLTCVLMNCLIGYSGKHHMDSIGNGISAYSEIENGEPDSFDPESKSLDRDELTIIVTAHSIPLVQLIGISPWLLLCSVVCWLISSAVVH